MATRKTDTTASTTGVDALTHTDDKRRNIPTAEYQSLMADEAKMPVQVTYPRATSNADHLQAEKQQRNRDLDPQLVWRGKDEQDWTDLVVNAPPLYIQEKVHPKVLIDDLLRQTRERREAAEARESGMADLFGDFNGIPEGADKTDFYAHDQNWTNRMILGDSLQVMASLAEREGLRGKVQCVYLDPPYGIKFNSNFQWSTTSRDVKDGNRDHVSREPEQVKAFRDTWRDGINSYLTYLRDRLVVARDLLADSGSVFVQIGDENVHRIRALLDEVFSDECFISEIVVKKKGSQKSGMLDPVNDYILWYSNRPRFDGVTKFRSLYEARDLSGDTVDEFSRVEMPDGSHINLKKYIDGDGVLVDFRAVPRRVESEFPGGRLFRPWPITNGGERSNQMDPVVYNGVSVRPPKGNCWRHTSRASEGAYSGMTRVLFSDRLVRSKSSLDFKRYLEDFPYKTISNWWDGFGGASDQIYVVQTNERIVERLLLMASDPGDLVLDPTCGSGTTAYVAEQWGRRWITIDTSRVALALARARIMGARFPYYLLADSVEGQKKEAELAGGVASTQATKGNIRQGFVYRRCAQITSGAIANNAEIDVIWDTWQAKLEPLREALNASLKTSWQEWEIPRKADAKWSAKARQLHADWWTGRIERQREIDASIAAKAESEYLYDRPYEDRKRVRVAGPFTVESLSPHRTLAMDVDDGLVDTVREPRSEYEAKADFASVMLENLKAAGVQQAHKADRISFTSIVGWPGEYICAEGSYMEGGTQRRAAIFIGPEFGTVSRPDLVSAAREAAEAQFDLLIACAFNFEAHAAEFDKLGRVPVLKARMNPDLHMAGELKTTGAGNLFVVFGEPDIRIEPDADGRVRVRVKGVDVFRPQTGEIESGGTESIALWMIDTDYNEESFFVRQAYFLGAADPYKALKTTLKAEIDPEAWATLNSDLSRSFLKPKTGLFAH